MSHPIGIQTTLFRDSDIGIAPFRQQLLKWIGNKQRFAHEIAQYFPRHYRTYHEPFLGSGAVLGTLAPGAAVAADVLAPLIAIWQTLQSEPETVVAWYRTRWEAYHSGDQAAVFAQIRDAYNAAPNGADLLFLSRACYGGVVRFRRDGYMSTPKGVHKPIHPTTFAQRVALWHARVQHTRFVHSDFEVVMDAAQPGDLVYCDPPYSDTQTILYGAQSFSLERLFGAIERCKARGVYVALSIDGTKKTGKKKLHIATPPGLFVREASVNCGRSMLRRFQMEGQSLETEVVTDKLLLTY
jgi:DNA adenine methylase